MNDETKPSNPLSHVQMEWGQSDQQHFGYHSDEERKIKRGLEDWELVESIPLSQKAVPYWFYAIVVVVLLVAMGLAFPFWGVRPGHAKHWLDWGFFIALIYIAVSAVFIYFMVHMYGAQNAGKNKGESPSVESDPSSQQGVQRS